MPTPKLSRSRRRGLPILPPYVGALVLRGDRLPLATAATLALLAGGSIASAQTVNATLRGTVTDTTGSVMAAAHVQLLEPATGQVVRESDSQANGNYEFDEIKPGSYKVRVTASGFRTYEANMVVLDSGQVRRVDAVLATGEVSDTVTVTEGAAVINTESATISDLYTARMHDESPQVQIYPSTYAMLTTFSGVQGGTGAYPVVNGQQQSQQSQTFDGIPNDLAGQQSNNANFFEQVAASLVNAPAESPVPALISQVTKRGDNTFHGKATYRIYDSVLDAANYFNPEKTPYLQHEWDLEASGPIWKDHTFFYAGWFAQRIPLGYTYQAIVPTASNRAGVFSSAITDPQTGRPFANNTIPQSRISAVALAVQNNYYPQPNFTTDSQLNYSTHFPFNSDLYRGDWPIVRIDHNLTKTNSFYGRWLMRQTPYVLNNGLPDLIWTRFRRHQQFAAGDTQLFGDKIVNNLRFGYSTDYIADGQTEAGQRPPNGADVLATIGLQGANPGNTTGQGFPEMDIAGYTSLSDVPGGIKSNDHIFNLNDVVDWQFGRHVIRVGGGLQRFSRFQGSVPDYGTFSFAGTYTGNAYADFLLGLPTTAARQAPLGGRELTLTEWNWFVEDSFKLSPRLSLNYGLRWDLYGTPSASDHLMYNFNAATGGITVDPQAITRVSPFFPSNIPITPGAVTAIADKTNFAPRVGAAYSLGGHQVVRGGYGLYTARLNNGGGTANFGQGESFNNFLPLNPQLGRTGPFSQGESYLNNANTVPGVTPLLQFPNPFPSSTSGAQLQLPSQSLYGYPRQVRHGHIHQFNATYENEIAHVGMRASYVGSRSTGLDYLVNIDKPIPSTTPFDATRLPYPQFQALTNLRYDGGAHYDALQFEAKRRFGGVTFDASYAYSHSKANYLDTENPYNVLGRWANDGVTRRHYATASLFWALPFGKDHAMFAGVGPGVQRFVGGWSVSAITYLASGLYFSPSYDGADSSNTGTVGGLPDLIGDPNKVPGGKSINNWFNQAAFAVPQPGTFGNALPNSLESQHLYQTQVSLTKTFNLTERVRFTFNSQISNLFNHPQFLSPSGDISVASGNQFTSQFGTFDSLETGQQRQITFLGGFSF